MQQKLDSLSKIALALGAINYMAISIDSVNEQIKMIPDTEGVHKEGIEQRDKILSETATELGVIMEKLGNLINAQDAICSLDQYVTNPAFMVVVQGHDDPDGDYDDL